VHGDADGPGRRIAEIAMLASPLAGILGASLRLAHVGAVEQMFGAVGQVRRAG